MRRIAAHICDQSQPHRYQTNLLIGRKVALGLFGITTLPAPSWALVDQFVTSGNEFFRRQHSTAEECRRLESWGGPFSDGFEIRCHVDLFEMRENIQKGGNCMDWIPSIHQDTATTVPAQNM